ncbi:MAG: hypothetical protein HC923_01995 [Myxococcales bacterium]|nr:hypothetical protein [Myxococcales bacterium]
MAGVVSGAVGVIGLAVGGVLYYQTQQTQSELFSAEALSGTPVGSRRRSPICRTSSTSNDSP